MPNILKISEKEKIFYDSQIYEMQDLEKIVINEFRDKDHYAKYVENLLSRFSIEMQKKIQDKIDSHTSIAVNSTFLEIVSRTVEHPYNLKNKNFYKISKQILETQVEKEIQESLNKWLNNNDPDVDFEEFLIIIENDNSKAFTIAAENYLRHFQANKIGKNKGLEIIKETIEEYNASNCLEIMEKKYEIKAPKTIVKPEAYLELEGSARAKVRVGCSCVVL
ncbi:MAG: hypothetical protein ULS35scaffold63_46 [Phage 33_17]|nr:MAG: hypothetical protein ULS35scaffold63_46 [Phage 33_17]